MAKITETEPQETAALKNGFKMNAIATCVGVVTATLFGLATHGDPWVTTLAGFIGSGITRGWIDNGDPSDNYDDGYVQLGYTHYPREESEGAIVPGTITKLKNLNHAIVTNTIWPLITLAGAAIPIVDTLYSLCSNTHSAADVVGKLAHGAAITVAGIAAGYAGGLIASTTTRTITLGAEAPIMAVADTVRLAHRYVENRPQQAPKKPPAHDGAVPT